MHQIKTCQWRLVVLGSMLAGHSVVSALEIEPGVGAGLLYTDNATLAPDNEEDDLILVGYAGVNVNEDSGPFRVSASADVTHLKYTENSFGDKTYPGLRAIAGWEQITDHLDWKVQNFFTQQRLDSVDGVTPDNIQNTNVFTFGPAISSPISARQRVTVTPEFRDFYYEDFDDSQQYALSANWLYRLYRTMDIGLDGGVTRVDYESGGEAQDYTRTNIHVGVSGSRTRSTYSVNLGRTRIDREESSSEDGFTGDLTLSYRLTGHSSARAYAASELTDTGNLLLSSETDPENGGFSNVQTSNDVLRYSIMRLTYGYEGAIIRSSVYGELRDLDYKGTESDRDTGEVGADLDYRVTQLLTTGIGGTYTRIKQTDIGSRDTRYSITGRLGYNLSRKLKANLDVRYQNQSSNSDSVSEYNESSVFVSLVYGFARVPHPGVGSRF